jgi:(1->4)-alpha-D-glucan 1-alpha-D-glucosylmutase
VQAKGLEDTAFYRYNLLLSLNEVGGDPSRFGRSASEFHRANGWRLEHGPFEMLATATHDTKLGEDVRARVNVLSELPEQWGREAAKWMRVNKSHRTLIDGEPAPDRNDEYRLYQALVGAWPLEADPQATEAPPAFIERLQAYMLKAARESKVHTSWLTPNEEYETALGTFVQRVLSGSGGARFLPAMIPFQRRVAALGMVNSLAQTTLKLGSPGVPDFYQGTDLWDLSLVDPDNRRPVDFANRERLLVEVDALLAEAVSSRAPQLGDWLQSWSDGRIKLLITAVGLRLRRDHPDLFQDGRYLPLETEASVRGNLVAFARIHDHAAALFMAPRLSAALTDDGGVAPLGLDRWKTSRILLAPELADRAFRDLVTGAERRPTVTGSDAWLFAGHVFETLPVAILLAT